MFSLCGPLTRDTPGVTSTTTTNLARLVAVTRALDWALHDPFSQGSRPVCIRYNEPYGAMVASGVWKAKKHKAAAAVARSAWKRLIAAKGEDSVWLRHVPAGHLWFGRAHGLALEGKGGKYRYVRSVD